jgi:hypothetical protein
MARASNYTLLSLDRYAKVMGINPAHFNGGFGASLEPVVFPDSGCNSIWLQHDWQDHDKVSREQLARRIAGAEEEVAELIGFPVAPMWVEQELNRYPKNAIIGTESTTDIKGRMKAFKARYGHFITAGRRSTAVVGEATVGGGTLVYSDEDGDSLYETATITLPLPASMSALTDACEFKTFFDGESEPEWEIRYPRSATITGGNIVLVFDAWMFIKPSLWEAFPTSDGTRAIDISTINNYVDTVDVYREYADLTVASATFYWETGTATSCSICGGVGCAVCSYLSQDGCIIARDVTKGIITPYPATYDSDNETWDRTTFVSGAEPDMIKVWYKSGVQDTRFLSGKTCDPMSLFWAQIIAWIATARLDRPLCQCGNLAGEVEKLRTDLGSFSRGSASQFQTADIKDCPFGTLRGEVLAWRRIKKAFRGKQLSMALI